LIAVEQLTHPARCPIDCYATIKSSI